MYPRMFPGKNPPKTSRDHDEDAFNPLWAGVSDATLQWSTSTCPETPEPNFPSAHSFTRVGIDLSPPPTPHSGEPTLHLTERSAPSETV